ncbi:UDP-N-acetylglucosamine 2-epimerase [Corynebacterium choanae]|uniref:UDP-N-acetylglucosamine 2-epimerase (non-hydrolyzing) n=1 Tax=Corynebacterium choanae TaxID=1862358 RepID=A0A3G6J5Y1_9CORY|nr:UDP-N-acetylglucosamine 2-epimerase (non-hydrolyzing) [Corynebacterium choanae]AZA13232.1 UDP-N-acetylglucosamine 2-epimerase [Corynebacterium choanae]
MTTPCKLLVVYGTRPEAIKIAPLVALAATDERFEIVTVSTGQHKEMVDQVNSMFGISPNYELSVMTHRQPLNMLLGKVLQSLDPILDQEAPAMVISQGDTSTALAAALGAFHREIPVAHLEAGLRTGNIRSPFPEEANRKLIAQVTSLHLSPTPQSRTNLLVEKFDPASIAVTGNTVIDALFTVRQISTQFTDSALQQLYDSDRRIVLVTTHRRENLAPMANIGRAIRKLAQQHPAVSFVLPAHLNPAVRAAMLPEIAGSDNVLVTEPLPYLEFVQLMDRSEIVLTDSGGVQEEAPSLGKPVLVMRENTERPEAIQAGTVRLVGTATDHIVTGVNELLTDAVAYKAMANAMNPYGDGHAAQRCLAAIADYFNVGSRLPDFNASA